MAALCSYHAAVSDTSVWNIEFENPFPVMKIFEILGVETQPISLQEISRDFRPYQGCIFVCGAGEVWCCGFACKR